MGSPVGELGRREWEVQRLVELTRGFWLSRAPVTQRQWMELMPENPSEHRGEDRPVECVTWYNAVLYCNRLSTREGLVPCYKLARLQGEPGTERFRIGRVSLRSDGQGYRLPTEAEWEYACRAGTTTATYAGDLSHDHWREPEPVLEQIAWYSHTSGGQTHPVGLKAPNAWGLHDMLGNVWEWVQDKYGEYEPPSVPAEPVRDPVGSRKRGAARVVRGGGWYSAARDMRAAYRTQDLPDDTGYYLGLRCARS